MVITDETDTKDEKEEKHMEKIDKEHYINKKKDLDEEISKLKKDNKSSDDEKKQLELVEKRLKFIEEHDDFMKEMKIVKNAAQDKDSTKELDEILKNGDTEMEDNYHSIKKLMLDEVKKEKDLKKLEEEIEAEKDTEKKDEKEKKKTKLKDDLTETSKDIDEKLGKMDYKTTARLEVKLEKTIIECDKANSGSSNSMDKSEASSLIAMFILVKLTYIWI